MTDIPNTPDSSSNTNPSTSSSSFKFRELKVYASTEWLADNKKKYRQVFDRYEASYIYAELSFYNKLFDRDDWEVDIELRCYAVKKAKQELCVLPFKRKVSKFDHVVFIREGWGNKKEGAFWKRGTYYWEAYIDGEKVATKYFYIEDTGQAIGTETVNPYLEVVNLKLYEGPYDDVNADDRVYYRSFSGEETRYIYVEMELRNSFFTKAWQCELFTKFYNDARELKGQVTRLQRIEKGEDTIKITTGWGSNVKGSWRKDHYSAELVFMDRLLAIVPFDIGDAFEEGLNPVYLPNQEEPLIAASDDEVKGLTFEEVIVKLDSLIGLPEIKQKVRDYAKFIQFVQLRKEKGYKEEDEISVHSVFVGNPGTGKTTVAKMMGKLYRLMGLLTRGHVHEVDRADLVGEYIGQTAPKVKEAIEKARGGVLFIDEAYALSRSADDVKDFGREVIEILVKEMSNGKGDLAIIVAGYPKEMKAFLETNPGLKSRFKHTYEFSDYMPQDLMQIAEFAAVEKGIKITGGAYEKISTIITDAYRNRDKAFGNARFVYDLMDKAKMNMALRVMSEAKPRELSKDDLAILTFEDVDKIKYKAILKIPTIAIDENLLAEAMEELDKLIGMDKIKTEVRELVRLVRYYRETGKNVLNKFYFHTVFVGNPGTGKTTVARNMTKILKALGVLERGHIVETDRQGLVAGYVGQTATKTAAKIDEAIGGVLFVDEAYALSNRGGSATGDFGDEAIQTILKRMEDQRGQFFVFVAGYTDNMETFLKTNPGLNSRFDKILKFEDYSPEELHEIALQMLRVEDLRLTEEANAYLLSYLKYIYQFRDKYFGNARTVRQIITEVVKKQNLRLSMLSAENRQNDVVELEDLNGFKLDSSNAIFNKKGIGFGS